MGKIALVTDSTSDLAAEILSGLGVFCVPLNVHFGDELFLDGVSITPTEFFTKLPQARQMPRTSQPSPGQFAEMYGQLKEKGYDQILSVHISEALSGTYQSANIARTMVEGVEIEVVDSKLASVGLGTVVTELAEQLQAGADLQSLKKFAEDMYNHVALYFAVDTLEYLEKNGRIGKAQSLLGTLLNVKPILTLESGVVASYEKVRGQKRVLPRLVELVKQKIAPGTDIRVAVAHGNSPDRAAQLAAMLQETYGVEPRVQFVGPVIGCHTGPGVLAVLALPRR